MPWSKEQRECTDSDGNTYEDGWVVTKDDTGEEVACVGTEAEANDVIAALEAQEGEEDRGGWVGDTYYRGFTADTRQQEQEDTVTFQINNDQLDRHGTIIEPGGGDLANFKRNPVVLWDHGMDPTRGSLPIGRAVNVFERGNSLFAEIQFDTDDDFASKVLRQVKEGITNGTSIGFRAGDVDRSADPTRIRQWELVEISVTPTPSNPAALVESRNQQDSIHDTLEELRSEIAALKEDRDANSSADDADEESGDEPDKSSAPDVDETAAQVPAATDADYKRTAKKLVTLAKRELGKA